MGGRGHVAFPDETDGFQGKDTQEGETLKIGELAAFYGVSVKALRLYEKKGLIRPSFVDRQTGYRYYRVDQVHQVRVLLELRALGFSLREIKEALAGGLSGEGFREALQAKRREWQERISLAEDRISCIDAIAQSLQASGGVPSTDGMTEEERAWLLVKMVCVAGVGAENALSEALWV